MRSIARLAFSRRMVYGVFYVPRSMWKVQARGFCLYGSLPPLRVEISVTSDPRAALAYVSVFMLRGVMPDIRIIVCGPRVWRKIVSEEWQRNRRRNYIIINIICTPSSVCRVECGGGVWEYPACMFVLEIMYSLCRWWYVNAERTFRTHRRFVAWACWLWMSVCVLMQSTNNCAVNWFNFKV